MKIIIEDYLQKIDLTFKEKSQKDLYMTYIMIFSAIFAFSYLFFWDSSADDFEQQNIKITSLESKIKEDRMFLQYNPETKIALLENEIKKAKDETLMHQENNEYIKAKIETISSLIYDERSWGEYLHSISINAKTYNVQIINFTNKYAFNNTSFGHILDITIEASAKYEDTLKFINSLEQSELVVDIHGLKIKADDTLNTDLNISVWGITY